MSCNTALTAIVRDCAPNAGGIKRVLFANFDDVSAISLATDGSKIESITMATSAHFTQFYVRPETASFTSTPQFNDAGDYAGEEMILSLGFNKRETAKRAAIAALSVNELRIIIEDNNGIYWLMAYDHPALRSGGEETTGTALSDTNRYGMEFRCRDGQPVYEVPSTVVAGIEA